MTAAKGYAAQSPTTDLAPWNFERREMGSNDVQIKISYCCGLSPHPAVCIPHTL